MERRELETAAAKYSYLRGLLALPLGALFIVAALGNWEVGPLRHSAVFIAAMVTVGLGYLAVARYYNERYGRLKPSARQQLRGAVAVTVGVLAMAGGSLLLSSQASWSLDLPVNAIAVSFAVLMLASYAITVGLKTHHVVIWGGLLLAGALPVWTGEDPSNIALVLAGACVMVNGVFDHRLFVRTFGPPTMPAVETNARA